MLGKPPSYMMTCLNDAFGDEGIMKHYLRKALVPFVAASMLAGGSVSASELIVGSASMPRSLANPLGDGSHSGRWKFQLAFDPVTYGTSTGTQPGLALSWKNTSPTTWELKVRKNAVFHDGKPFHSSDIADLINWLNTDEGKAKGISTLRNKANIIAARVIDDETLEVSTKTPAFESNQIDLAFEVSPGSRSRVESANGKLVISSTPQNINLMFFQNRPGTPLHDVRVRMALNYAVDKEAFVDTILGGLTVPAGQPAARAVNGYNPTIKAYPYDPAKARQLLAEAGYGNGLELKAEAVVNVAERREIYSQVALDAAKVGVKITIAEITLPDLIKRVRDTSKLASLFGFNYGSEPTMDVMRSLNALHSCNTRTKWTCFPDIEATIKAANEEFDVDKRREMLKQINQHYHDQASAIFLYEEVQIDAVANKVKGYAPNNRIINWADMTVDG